MSRSLTGVASIWIQGLVREAESLGEVVKIGMLGNHIPVGEVLGEVSVRDGKLHTPVLLVVDVDMPVDFHRTHILGAVQNIGHVGTRADRVENCMYLTEWRVPEK
jgi:hypothetical protein